MGFFDSDPIGRCFICDEPVSFRDGKLLSDHQFICNICRAEKMIAVDKNDTPSDIERKIVEKGFTSIDEFRPTKRIKYSDGRLCSYIEVDERHELFNLPRFKENYFSDDEYSESIHKFMDLIDFQLIDNGNQVVDGDSMMGAVIGGLAFGNTMGAILGSGMYDKKVTQKCNELKIKLTLNDMQNPTEYITFIDSPVSRDKDSFKKAYTAAQDCLSLLTIILRMNREYQKECKERERQKVEEQRFAERIRLLAQEEARLAEARRQNLQLEKPKEALELGYGMALQNKEKITQRVIDEEEAEASERAEEDANQRAIEEAEAKERAEEEAKQRAIEEAEAKKRAEEEAKQRAIEEAEAKKRAEEEAKQRAIEEAEAKKRAEEEAKQRAIAEARGRAEMARQNELKNAKLAREREARITTFKEKYDSSIDGFEANKEAGWLQIPLKLLSGGIVIPFIVTFIFVSAIQSAAAVLPLFILPIVYLYRVFKRYGKYKEMLAFYKENYPGQGWDKASALAMSMTWI